MKTGFTYILLISYITISELFLKPFINAIHRLKNDPSLRLGDVTTINMTMMKVRRCVLCMISTVGV